MAPDFSRINNISLVAQNLTMGDRALQALVKKALVDLQQYSGDFLGGH